MPLSPGTRLGPYEVNDRIGEGGMGEVYRGLDTDLHRSVAIKVLPESFVTDTDRVARFRREAQLLAAINHPNIAQVYGLEHSGGVQALVMELVEGEDLATRIRRGPIPIEEALLIARQIAEALAAAHEQGIVHRDLKPANIRVRADDVVKVLDFGLAKFVESATPVSDQSPTVTTPALSEAGLLLGTAAYMSPEQVKGRAADKRADIWAFGGVLFEMLTGRRAFRGESTAELFAAILRAEVTWSELPRDTPPEIRRLLRRCLERDAKLRLHDISDARLEIADALSGRDETATASPVARSQRPWKAAVLVISGIAAIGLAALGVFAMRGRLSSSPDAGSTRFSIPIRGMSLANWYPAISVSPDGRSIVVAVDDGVAGVAGRTRRLELRRLDSVNFERLRGTDGGVSPQFMTNDRVAFVDPTTQDLKTIDIQTNAVQIVCRLESDHLAGASLGPDGSIVFANRAGGAPFVLKSVAARSLICPKCGNIGASKMGTHRPQKTVSSPTSMNAQVASEFPDCES